MTVSKRDLGSPAGAAPFAPVLPSPSATQAEIQRAANIACGASVLPSRMEWRAYRGASAYIPNYWTIESADYTDSGFSISGYIHDDDARLIAAARELLEALRRADHTLSLHGKIDGDTDLHEFIRAAIAKATHPLEEGQNRAQSAGTQI